MTPLLAILTALALVGSLVAGINAPRGPLNTCACGKRFRQQGREKRAEFEARVREHAATCAALAPITSWED